MSRPLPTLLATLTATMSLLGARAAYADDPPYARETPEDSTPDAPPTTQPQPPATTAPPDATPPTAPAVPPPDAAPPPPAARPHAKRPIPMDEKLVFVRSPRMDRLLRRGVTWDANLEGGVGAVFAHPVDAIGFARARAGLTLVRDPLLETLGVTYEYSGLSPATLGLQAEVSLLETGLWGQVGAMMDVKGHAGGMLALGWALVGVEGEYRAAESMGPTWAVYGKLRIPVSILIRSLGR